MNPILDYEHGGEANEGFSITGGYVYRGPLSELRGRYFFGDYVNERIWSIRYDGMSVTERIDWTAAFVPIDGAINEIVSFGEDAAGNLYVVDLGGEIFRVTRRVEVPGLSAIGLSLLIVSLLGIAAFLSYRPTAMREGPRGLG